ncbi:MAG: hypothetical protein WB048_06155, partial [Pseudolabrys sp.]
MSDDVIEGGQCPLLARSGHTDLHRKCPQSNEYLFMFSISTGPSLPLSAMLLTTAKSSAFR